MPESMPNLAQKAWTDDDLGTGAVVAAPTPLPADDLVHRISGVPRFVGYGRVTRVVGLVIEAVGIDVGLGELCRVTSLTSARSVLAEVVGFHERGVLLMPLGDMDGLEPGGSVQPLGRSFGVDVGPESAGPRAERARSPDRRARARSRWRSAVPLSAEPPNPLWNGRSVDEPLETGVRAIDGTADAGQGAAGRNLCGQRGRQEHAARA
jgi:flagellum-specific ATP synthase